MITVRFTAHLKRWFPGLDTLQLTAATVRELIPALDMHHPGLCRLDRGRAGSALRQHVNIFVNRSMIHDRQGLGDTLAAGDEVHIFQALSGG
jgi:molybdopterin synthase sulfur carrier subunit